MAAPGFRLSVTQPCPLCGLPMVVPARAVIERAGEMTITISSTLIDRHLETHRGERQQSSPKRSGVAEG